MGRVGVLGWLGYVLHRGGWGVVNLEGWTSLGDQVHLRGDRGVAFLVGLGSLIGGSVWMDLVSPRNWLTRVVRVGGYLVSSAVVGCLVRGYFVPLHGDVVVELGVVKFFVNVDASDKADLFARAYLAEVTRQVHTWGWPPDVVDQFLPRVDELRDWLTRADLAGVSCEEMTNLGTYQGEQDFLARVSNGRWKELSTVVVGWVIPWLVLTVVAEVIEWYLGRPFL